MSRRRALADVSQFLARCLSAWYSQGRRCSWRPRGCRDTVRNRSVPAARDARFPRATRPESTCTRRNGVPRSSTLAPPGCSCTRSVTVFFPFFLPLRREPRTPSSNHGTSEAPGSTPSFLRPEETIFLPRRTRRDTLSERVSCQSVSTSKLPSLSSLSHTLSFSLSLALRPRTPKKPNNVLLSQRVVLDLGEKRVREAAFLISDHVNFI